MLIKAYATKGVTGEGVWRTINGSPVFIQGGKITKGPARLVGSTASDVEGSSKEDDSKSKRDISGGKSGKDTKDLLPDYDNMTDDEALAKLSENGIETLEDAIEKQGFNGLPTVMNDKDFRGFVENGGIELSRGISASDTATSDDYVNSLKYGEFYIAGGEAYFGKGMYAFGGDSLANANSYAMGNGGKVMSMALPKDAKILEVKGKEGLRSKEVIKTFYNEEDSYKYGQPVKNLVYNKNNRLAKYEEFISDFASEDTVNFLRSKGYKIPKDPDIGLLSTDMGKYFSEENKFKNAVKSAGLDYLRKTLPKEDVKLLIDHTKINKGNNIVTACRGYDAIKLSPEYVDNNSSNGASEIWIVLNRSKLVIKED